MADLFGNLAGEIFFGLRNFVGELGPNKTEQSMKFTTSSRQNEVYLTICRLQELARLRYDSEHRGDGTAAGELLRQLHGGPSIREIAKDMGLAASTVHEHVKALIVQRRIGKIPGHRGLRLLRTPGAKSRPFFELRENTPPDFQRTHDHEYAGFDDRVFPFHPKRLYFIGKVLFEDDSALGLRKRSVIVVRYVRSPQRHVSGSWFLVSLKNRMCIRRLQFRERDYDDRWCIAEVRWGRDRKKFSDWTEYTPDKLCVHGVIDAVVATARDANFREFEGLRPR